MTIAVPKRGYDGTDGNSRQKDSRILRISREKYYQEAGIMNASKNIETWNAEMKDLLESLSEVTSREADFEDPRKLIEGSRCSLGGTVERIYNAPVGSVANESGLW